MNNDPITGSCLCGQIQYEYRGEVGPAVYCHCSDCRRVTGSAFIISVRFEEEEFKYNSKYKTKRYTKVADSGNSISRDFCPNCGSPVFTISPRHPGYIWVRAGTLDDPTVVKPAYQNWIDSKVQWSEIPKDLESHRKGKIEQSGASR